MTLPASCLRRLTLTLALFLSTAALPGAGWAQTSAAAAVTHAAASPGLTPGGVSAVLNAARTPASDAPNFLAPDQAFQVSATAAGPDRVRIDWQIADGYYLYRSRIKVKTDSPVQLGVLALPEGETHNDEYFGPQQIYHHALSATLPVARAAGAARQDVAVAVTYQGCAHAGLCYPPITKTLAVTLPPAGTAGGAGAAVGATDLVPASPAAPADANGGGYVSEQNHLAMIIRSGNLVVMLGTFFVIGLGLAFTPCVLPMVPILSGIIAGHGDDVTTARAFLLSLTYVLGMAFTYTVAGIAVATAGSHVQALFQQTWIILLFAALFVVLALSMLGLFTIQMPAAIQTRLSDVSNRQSAGSFSGVAVMGALSALIVTTCVAPPLVATYVVIGQSGNLVRGAAALLTLSLGMGAPLLVVGASQGRLLPKAGPWMETIKQLFGVMMLGVAVWMLARVTAPGILLLLWAVPAAVAAAVLWRGARGIRHRPLLVRAAAVLAGAYALVLLVGAGLGSADPLAPIPAFGGHHETLSFQTIKSVDDLDRAVTRGSSRHARFLRGLVRVVQGDGEVHLHRSGRSGDTQGRGTAARQRDRQRHG